MSELLSLFIRPLYDIEELLAYADDNGGLTSDLKPLKLNVRPYSWQIDRPLLN